MWSKAEAQQRTKRFYTNFGIYMKKYISKYDRKIPWVNYRTGVSAVTVKVEADNKTARVCIDIIDTDNGIKALFYEQFEEFKTLLQSEMSPLIWEPNYTNENGQSHCRIFVETSEYSISNEEHWGDIYRFFEKNLVAFHEFWDNCKDIFIDLEN